jgi:hypothetical protein
MWEAVEAASRTFDAAMNTWLQSGSEADKQRLRDAYRDLMGCWKRELATPGALT